MFKNISNYFNKAVPKAEVHTFDMPRYEDDAYFQLLADYGIRLNEPQKQAVKAVEGPVQCVAGAGSGKTMMLTSRIGYMIHTKQINPSNILLVTFTKKAAVDMIERLARIPGMSRAAVRSVVAGTYHSICLRILRAEGYDFQVLSSEKKKHYIIKVILKDMGLQDQYKPETVLAIISNWKNQIIRWQDIEPNNDLTSELREIYRRYEEFKDNQNLLDFDDFLLETYYLLLFDPDVLKKYQRQFLYICCDEFQDTSPVQWEIIKMLAAPQNNLCIVGDDWQCIYQFRSASSRLMLDFDKVYPNCRRVILDINYRSGASIVGMANQIISHNKHQIRKSLKVAKNEDYAIQFARPFNSEQEAEWVVEDIKNRRLGGERLKDMAVIYRTHATGRAIFEKLLLEDIPFVTYSNNNESFYQNTYIRPILALLRLSVYENDVDALIEGASALYISRKEMEGAIDEVTIRHNGYTPKNLFTQVIRTIARKKAGFQQQQLLSKLESIKMLKNERPASAILELRVGAVNYERLLEVDERKTLTIHKEMLIEILDEFETAARRFDDVKSFLDFIDRVEEKNKEMEELRKDPNIEAVRLMTIHASKGLEFDTVYAIGFIENILPHISAIDEDKKEDSNLSPEEALEEERRLAYVCLTRAKKHLLLSAPKTHRNKDAEISRFLLEGLEVKGEKKRINEEKSKIHSNTHA